MIFNIMVVNRSKRLKPAEVRKAVRAINIQLRQHFGPAWNISCGCFLEIKSRRQPHHGVIFIDDEAHEDALGYHDYDAEKLLPYGFVFLDIVNELGEPFSVTLSHEILELVLNRHCNYYAIGRHPLNSKKMVAHWLEACDAVQSQTYFIQKVEVSDFLYPFYFTPDHERGGQNNHCSDWPVPSFGVNHGGYIGFYDFDLRREETFFHDDDAVSRFKTKNKAGKRRRKERVSQLLAKGA